MSERPIPMRKPAVLELESGTYYWCRCAKSANQPFCDGSHAGTDDLPLAFEQTERKKIALCQCKRTDNAPRCDGTHSRL
jgi:CDGSH iron-sulfur domain-containing protein 3